MQRRWARVARASMLSGYDTGETLARWVIEQGEADLLISDVNRDARAPAEQQRRFLRPTDVRWSACRSGPGGKMLGIIQLMNIDMRVYARNEILLQTLADYAAIAIENARAVSRIQELSITDDCTGLYNARHLFTVLAEEVHRSRALWLRIQPSVSRSRSFQAVNDQHGHLIGSKLLGQVGQALRENLRLVDAAFRYGG